MAGLIKHNINTGFTDVESPASVEYALHHCFRSFNKPSRNNEIDSTLTKNNYSLTPENRGRTTEECMSYYNRLLADSYIYGKDAEREIVKCLEWSIQVPSDLASEQKPEFFKACYEYMNELYGAENCIAAVVHTDEIMLNAKGERISHDHLHYLSVPRVKNTRYLTAEEKFQSGLAKLRENGLLPKNEDVQQVVSAVNRFYKNKLSKNETISEIARETECKYTDARKIYNAVVRKDSELHKQKLNSDALTSRKQLHEFHPGLQKYLDDCGIKCTVSYKSQGIERDVSYTIAEAKTVTRVTGLSIEKIKSLEIENNRLHEQIISLTKELNLNKEHERESIWGSSSEWGKNRGKTWEIEKEF